MEHGFSSALLDVLAEQEFKTIMWMMKRMRAAHSLIEYAAQHVLNVR
jgi:hypothetical protein